MGAMAKRSERQHLRRALLVGVAITLSLSTGPQLRADEVDDFVERFRQLRVEPIRQRQADIKRIGPRLLRFDKKRVRKALFQLYREEPNILMRMTLLKAIGRFEGEEVRDFLIRELGSSSERVQSAAASQIGRHLDRKSLQSVLQLFRKGNLTSAVRGPLEKELGQLKDPQLFEQLLVQTPKIRSASGLASMARIFGAQKRTEAIPLLCKLTHHRTSEVQFHALEALRQFEPTSFQKIFERATKSRNIDVAFSGILGLGRYASTNATASRQILECLRHKESWRQIAGAEAVGRNGLIEGFGLVLERLESPEWPVRSAAIENLERLRMAGAIGPLIARIEKETGRLRQDVIRTLESLSGQSFGDSIANWQSWWQRNEKGFRMPPKADFSRSAAKGMEAAKSEVGYFGIPIHSRAIVFVLDISNSMLTPFDRQGSVPVGDSKNRRAASHGENTRLDAARKNLVEVIHGFSSDVQFNIVFFHSRTFLWQKKLTPATESNKKRAELFVMDQKTGLQTLIHDSVEKGMRMSGVDTLILLTDGAPTMGKFIYPAEMVREILRLNRTLRIRFHTIDLGGQQTWMARLAIESGGQTVKRE